MATTGERHVTFAAHGVHQHGGMERALYQVVVGLLERGWTVRVVTGQSGLPAHPNLQVELVACPSRPFVLEHLVFLVTAERALRKSPPPGTVVTLGAVLVRPVDAIIVQYVNASGRRDRPPVRHVARRGYAALAHHLAALHERWSYRSGRVRAILPVSDALRDEIRAAFPHLKVACEVVPNGVESTRFHPDETARRDVRCEFDLGDHDLVAVFVGGDWARKGLAVAIEGITRARDRWTLMVVGDGDVAAYRSLADRHGVADRVVFAGRSAEPEREMAAADVFVLPSAYEGFPLVAIEAAATGLPLVVTAAANCEPLLRAGAGLEVDRSGVGVASALDRLSDVETRALAAGRAREAGLAHEWSHIADRHESVYLSV